MNLFEMGCYMYKLYNKFPQHLFSAPILENRTGNEQQIPCSRFIFVYMKTRCDAKIDAPSYVLRHKLSAD